jgi:hypothetical protein
MAIERGDTGNPRQHRPSGVGEDRNMAYVSEVTPKVLGRPMVGGVRGVRY